MLRKIRTRRASIERDEVKRMATRTVVEIDDASLAWRAPAYDSLKDLNFNAKALGNQWPTYQTEEGPS